VTSGSLKVVNAMKPAHDLEILLVRDRSEIEKVTLHLFQGEQSSHDVIRNFAGEITIPSG
jgi:hypothetical protein